MRSVRDRRSHSCVDPSVQGVRNDDPCFEVGLGYARSDRSRSHELHSCVDRGGSNVKRTAEDPRKRWGAVDLVQTIATTRPDYADGTCDVVGMDLRIGIGERKKYGVRSHEHQIVPM